MKQIFWGVSIALLVAACQSPSPPSETALEGEAGSSEATAAAGAIANESPSPTPTKTGTVRAEPSLRIHASPGTNTPVIDDAPNGTRLNIYAETSLGDSVWYQVRAQSNDFPQQLGWAYGGNIVVAGEDDLTSDRPTTPSLDQGYREGYQLGYRDGENFREYNSGYNPDGALQAGSGNPDPAYDQAYRRGFYAGFDAGYYSNPYNDDPKVDGGPAEPDVDTLNLTCSGSFSNDTRFTVEYTREAGFSRFTLDPNSGSPVTVNLTYSGVTDAQHGVWEGTLGESEVRVDHLSSQAAQPGDEVNVEYNIFSGRAVCR